MDPDKPHAPWWLNPIAIVAVVAVIAAGLSVILLSTGLLTSNGYVHLTDRSAALNLAGYFALLIGVLAGLLVRSGRVQAEEKGRTDSALIAAANLVTAIALFGYAAWVSVAVLRGVTPAMVISVLLLDPGALSAVKALSAPVPGLTTLVGFAPAGFAIHLYYWMKGRRRSRQVCLLIISVTVARAFLYAERLAIFELALPAATVILLTTYRKSETSTKRGNYRARWRSVLVACGPLMALLFGWLVFVVSEFTRSWQWNQDSGMNLFRYATLRLGDYYLTSLNNSALYFSIYEGAAASHYHSLSALYEFPILGTVVLDGETAAKVATTIWTDALSQFADPQFTNIGSILVLVGEIGLAGSMMFYFAFGAVLGGAYNKAKSGSVTAAALYGSVLVGVLELLRYSYWTQGRFLAVIFGYLALLGTYKLLVTRAKSEGMQHV